MIIQKLTLDLERFWELNPDKRPPTKEDEDAIDKQPGPAKD